MNMLPRGTTTGVLGTGMGANPGHSLYATVTDNLRNSLSEEDTQKMASAGLGLSRGLATIETSGLVPSGTFTQGFENYMPRAGDKEGTVLWKMSQMRQVVENGAEVAASNPRFPPKLLAEFNHIVDQVKTAIPYTPEDVHDFSSAPAGTSFGQFIQQKHPGVALPGLSGGGNGTATPDNPRGAAGRPGNPPGQASDNAPAGGAPMSLDAYLKSQGH